MATQRLRDHLALFGEAGDYLLGLLTITNPQVGVLPEPLRLCSTDHNVLSRGLNFFGVSFDYKLPSKEQEGEQRTSIVLPVVDRTILEALRSTHVRFDLLLEVTFKKTPDVVEFFFRLKEHTKLFDAAAQTLTVECGYRDVMQNPRPRKRYSPSGFPALFGQPGEVES